MSVDVWAIGFPGASAEQARTARLALVRLMQGTTDDDPCRYDVAGLLARDLPCSRATARRTIDRLHWGGWVDAEGRVVGGVTRI